MIIKSLSRQNKSFKALYKYLTREKDSILRGFNLYSNTYIKSEVVKEFLENATCLKRSRGKNYYYHEIISLAKNNLSTKEQEKILSDLVSKYISLRAENHLTFTALHTDKEHTHIHLMISANEYMGTKRVRLSKKDFSTIQKELEQYVNTIYPELGQTRHYNKDFSKFRSKKEELIATLDELFKKSHSRKLFEKYSKDLNLEFYTRGKTQGVIFEGKKYRLKTLGVLENYEALQKNLEDKMRAKEEQEDRVRKWSIFFNLASKRKNWRIKKMDNQTNTQDNQEHSSEQSQSSSKKDKEWIAFRKAKRDGRLSEHRKMLRSSAYRKMKKSEANQEDRTRQK